MIKRNLFNRDYIVILISLLISFLIFSETDLMDYSHPHFKNIWNHHKYLWMAKNNPFDFHIAPFCWKVFVPTLEKILPFGVENNFKLIFFVGSLYWIFHVQDWSKNFLRYCLCIFNDVWLFFFGSGYKVCII